jgi:hypothetical protein
MNARDELDQEVEMIGRKFFRAVEESEGRSPSRPRAVQRRYARTTVVIPLAILALSGTALAAGNVTGVIKLGDAKVAKPTAQQWRSAPNITDDPGTLVCGSDDDTPGYDWVPASVARTPEVQGDPACRKPNERELEQARQDARDEATPRVGIDIRKTSP